jgi:hypothetical protein
VFSNSPTGYQQEGMLQFRQDMTAWLSTRLLRMEAHPATNGGTTLLTVVDSEAEQIRPQKDC